MTLKIYRAESYAGLREFNAAIEDLNAVLSELPSWPEVKLLFYICVHANTSPGGSMHSVMVTSFNRTDWLIL